VARYSIDRSGTRMLVMARSSIHDTTTTFPAISGTVDADPGDLKAAQASFQVQMAEFDAGDWLKNRKMKSELAPDKFPSASFELREIRDLTPRDDGSFEAVAHGTLRYRGREVQAAISGKGTITDQGIEATGNFDIDLRDFGMKPPRVLMFKMEPVLSLDISLRMHA